MIAVRVDASELLRYVRGLVDASKETPTRLARALNETGDNLAREVRTLIAVNTGLDSEMAARNMVRVSRATRNHLNYDITVSDIGVEGEVSSRTIQRRTNMRGMREDEFVGGELVKVVTAGDARVCPICEAIAEGSPYTIEEAREQVHHGGPIGTNECRCVLVPWVSQRRIMVTQTSRGFGQPGRGENLTDERLTMRKLAERVLAEAGQNFRFAVR